VVQGVQAMRMKSEKIAEMSISSHKVFGVVGEESKACEEKWTCWEY